MCLNWKVLAGLGAVGVGIYLFAPDLAVAALPVLVLAACPLSMLLMMWGMNRMQGNRCETQGRRVPEETDAGLTREERVARLQAQQAALADQVKALEQEEEPQPTKNGKGR